MPRGKKAGPGMKTVPGTLGISANKKRKQILHKQPLNRAPKRKIVRWNQILDRELLLVLVHVCNYLDIKLPWKEVAKVMARGITAGAIIQHIAKLRIRHAENGYPVPPPLARGGGKIRAGSCKPEISSILKGIKAKESLEDYEVGSKTLDFVYCLSKANNVMVEIDDEGDETDSTMPKKRRANAPRQLQKKSEYADGDSDGDIIKAGDISDSGDNASGYCSDDETVEATYEEDTVAAGASFLKEVDDDEDEETAVYHGSASDHPDVPKQKNLVVKLAIGHSKAAKALICQSNNGVVSNQKSPNTEDASNLSMVANYVQEADHGNEAKAFEYHNNLEAQNQPFVPDQGTFEYGSGAMEMPIYNTMAQEERSISSAPGLAIDSMFQPGQYHLNQSEIIGNGYQFPQFMPHTNVPIFKVCEASGWTPMDQFHQPVSTNLPGVMDGYHGCEQMTSGMYGGHGVGFHQPGPVSTANTDTHGYSGDSDSSPIEVDKKGSAHTYYNQSKSMGNGDPYQIYEFGASQRRQKPTAGFYKSKEQAFTKTPMTPDLVNYASANNEISPGTQSSTNSTGFCAKSGTIDPNLLQIQSSDNMDISFEDNGVDSFIDFGLEDSFGMNVE